MRRHTSPNDDLEPNDHLEPDERDIEAPTADAVEQATPAYPHEDQSEVRRARSGEVNEYDAIEQARVVELDEDDADRSSS